MTLAACKRLKAKREKAKEIAELDVGNIIESSKLRSTRSTRLTTASCLQSPVPLARRLNKSKLKEVDEDDESSDEDDDETEAEATDFSRIKDLIESDESDSSNKKEKKKSRTHKNAVSDSE